MFFKYPINQPEWLADSCPSYGSDFVDGHEQLNCGDIEKHMHLKLSSVCDRFDVFIEIHDVRGQYLLMCCIIDINLGWWDIIWSFFHKWCNTS